MKTLEEMKNDCLITVGDFEKDIKILQDTFEKMEKAVVAAKTTDDLLRVADIACDEIKKTHYLELRHD